MDPLIATNGKLVDELRFERHMNTLLDSFRNYAMLLINDCKCDANEEVVRKLNQLNDEYIGRKSGRTVEQKAVQLLCETMTKSGNTTGDGLDVHSMTSQSNGQSDGNTCHECRQVFNTEDLLLAHLNRSHNSLDENNSPLLDTEMNGQNMDSFLNNLNLESVAQKRKSAGNPSSGKRLRSSRKRSLSSAKDSGEYSIYFPRVVPKEVKTVDPIECEECHKMLASATALEIHTNKHHKKAMPFVCTVCEKNFFANLSLLNHLSQKHKICAFECESCDYKTRTKHHLIQHQVKHSNQRPFECDADGCYMRFKRKDLLTRHKSLMH